MTEIARPDRTCIPVGVPAAEPRYVPWIGAEYQASLGPYLAGSTREICLQRVLVLGESHYVRAGDLDSYVDTPDLTMQVVRDWAISTTRRSAFFTRVATAVEGEVASVDTAAAWSRFAFAEFVQTAVASGPRVAPSTEQWDEGRRCFFALLARLRPQLVIVLGRRLWRELPDDVGVDLNTLDLPEKLQDTWVYSYLADGMPQASVAVHVTHPSAGYGHWKPEIARNRVLAARRLTPIALQQVDVTCNGN